jgi:hypothetical protein
MVLAVFVDELAKCGGSSMIWALFVDETTKCSSLSMILAIFLDEKGAVRAWLGDTKPRKKQKL